MTGKDRNPKEKSATWWWPALSETLPYFTPRDTGWHSARFSK